MNKIVRILIYVVLLIVGPGGLFLLAPASVHYQIAERYAFSSARPGAPIRLAVMLPQSGPYQTVENIAVDWAGEETRASHDAVDVLMLEGAADGDGVAEAVLTYDVALESGRLQWEAPVQAEDLEPAEEIEADAPVLVAEAEEIAVEQLRESAYQIYAFTAQRLSWPTGSQEGEDQSALTAHQTGIGVCGDFANLMTALCRAADIPARAISGLSFPLLMPPFTARTSTWLHPAGSHAWVEVYTGEAWELADPSLASRMPFDRFWFGRSSGQYLSYGESVEQDWIYAEMMAWAEEDGEIVGAMSAPLRFVASVEGAEATLTPTTRVKKVGDVRWLGTAGLYVAILVGAVLLETRLK
jgi:hypothetical protein